MCCGLNLSTVFSQTVGKSTQAVRYHEVSSLREVWKFVSGGEQGSQILNSKRQEKTCWGQCSRNSLDLHPSVLTHRLTQNIVWVGRMQYPHSTPGSQVLLGAYTHCLATAPTARFSTLPTIDAEMKLFRSNYKAIFQPGQVNTAQAQHVNAEGGHSMKE